MDRTRVVRALLERNAEQQPDAVAVSFEDGTRWTWRETLEEAYRAANTLRESGVKREDRVGILLTNGAGILRAWWGSACLGATIVPFNPSWKGLVLGDALSTAQPLLVVTNEKLAPALHNLDTSADFRVMDAGELTSATADEPLLDRPIEPWDRHHIHFTSGTTGPSKGVAGTYRLLYATGSWIGDNLHWTPEDTELVDLPLFHAAAQAATVSCLDHGASLAVRGVPAMSRYWEVAKETGATHGFVIGTMANFLMSRPPSDADRDHSIRAMNSSPLPPNFQEFQERFGIDTLLTAYGSSESGVAIICVPGIPLIHGSSGRPPEGLGCRIVDDNDMEVPEGETGQLIIRSAEPWQFATEYYNNPEATVKLWRNGWLHTGDQMRRDSDGNYYFVDRLKDALRRRGENISSFEVERGAQGFPGVQETACVAFPDPVGGGDDVKVWVQPVAGADVDLLELARYMFDRLPYYMVPRYFEIIDELPKTVSMRVQKYDLRQRGNGPATWDLLESGYKVTRDGFVLVAQA